jgi:hypothetical protein
MVRRRLEAQSRIGVFERPLDADSASAELDIGPAKRNDLSAAHTSCSPITTMG